MCIYKLTCNVCGEFYIGCTVRPLKKRLKSHFSTAKLFPKRKLYSHLINHSFDVKIEKIKDGTNQIDELNTYLELKPTLNNNIPLVLNKTEHKKKYMSDYENKPKRIYYNTVIRKKRKEEAEQNLLLLENLPFMSFDI